MKISLSAEFPHITFLPAKIHSVMNFMCYQGEAPGLSILNSRVMLGALRELPG